MGIRGRGVDEAKDLRWKETRCILLVMTYDFGTTSLKAALVNATGRIVAHANEVYPLFQPKVGWAEQKPRSLWDAGARAGKRALEQAGISRDAVRSIVFVAPWKGIIPVGKNGTVLRDAIIWMDSRATAEADRLNERAGEFIGTGQEYWPRLMWLKRHEPELWEASQWIMGVNTYLKWMATGAVVTEPSDDFIRSDRPSLHARYQKILAAAGLADDIAKFPPSTAAGDIVGHLTESAAAHLGLTAGHPCFWRVRRPSRDNSRRQFARLRRDTHLSRHVFLVALRA